MQNRGSRFGSQFFSFNSATLVLLTFQQGRLSLECSFPVQASYLSAFTTFLWTCAPFLVAVSSFTAYILIDEANVLDAQTAFVSLTYFNLLRAPLNMLPQLIVLMVQCGVSLKRINTFMNADELDPTNVTRDEGFEWPVFAEQASYTWGSGATEVTATVVTSHVGETKKGYEYYYFINTFGKGFE